MMDTDIAQRLRNAGLAVIEVDGWANRGSSSFNPRGSVDHHTAGPPTGNAPSLNTCIHGRSDLPGPLCNVFMARDSTAYVVAAGTANHAGSGGWHGLSGNSSVYGIERENVGTTAEPWTPAQTDAAARAHAALIRGRADASMVCRHAEWTSRKIDTHTLTGDELRRRVADHLAGGPAPAPDEPPGRPEMFVAITDQGFYALFGSVLFTFRDMAAYGTALNESPNVPAVLIGNQCSPQDRQDLADNLTAQHHAVLGR